MDQTPIKNNEASSYDACTGNDEQIQNQEEETFDSGYKAWCVCAISATINMILYGIVACQGIHLLVNHASIF